jgi:hypothetical protein
MAGLLVAACGGGDDDNGDDNGDEPTATVPAGDRDADDGDGADDGDADNGDGADLGDELRDLAAQFGVEEVKIEYDFSATGDGADETGSMTLYWKPPDAWRMDFSGGGEDAIFITTDEASYICAEDQCLLSPLAEAIPIPFLSFITEPEELSDLIGENILGLDVDRSEREIAGMDATCFSMEGTIEGETGSGEYCFSDNGILLLLRAGGSGMDGAGEFSLEATSVDDEVDDEDFEPPFPVTDLSDLLE